MFLYDNISMCRRECNLFNRAATELAIGSMGTQGQRTLSPFSAKDLRLRPFRNGHFPKSGSMQVLTEKRLKCALALPSAYLGFRTPTEVFYARNPPTGCD